MSPIADYNLGTARGRIEIDYDGRGVRQGEQGLDSLGRKAGSARGALDSAATGMGAAGLAIGAGLGLAVKSAADFEAQLSELKAVSGATGTEMDAVSKKALQLGKDTKFSASEAAVAMTELVKAGISVPDVLNGAADAAVNLAAAGGVELPEAAELAANAMNQFNLTARELPKVADLIAGAANASAIDVHDFGESLKQVGAAANLAGISFGDTATAIALMGQAGIKGSDAGTSLKTMLLNLIPTTEKQRDLMRELGLLTKEGGNAFFEANGKAKDLAAIAGELNFAMRKMTQQQKLATLETLFGSDAIRAAAVLSKAGAEGFRNMAGAMGKVKAADVAKTKMDNLKGSLEEFKGSLETSAIVIGTILLPALKKVVDSVTGVVNSFTDLSDGTQKTILIVAAAAGTFLLMAAAIIKVVFFIQRFIQAMALIQAAMATTFLTNPIFLVIAAIVALIAIIVLLAVKCEAFRNFFINIWDGIVSFFRAILPPIVDTAKQVFGQLLSIIVKTLDAITLPVRVILALVLALFYHFFRTLFNLAKGFWSQFGQPIKLAFELIARFLITRVRALFTAWKIAWALFGPIVKNMLNFLLAAVRAFTSPVWRGFVVLINGIFKLFRNAGKWLYNVGKNIIIGLWNGIAALGRWIADRIRSLIANVVPRPIRDILGIGSPSKLMYGYGQDTGKGFELGLESQRKMIARAAADLASAAIPGTSSSEVKRTATEATAASSAASGSSTQSFSADELADAMVRAMERRSISMATITENVNRTTGRLSYQRKRTG